jgi:hypothetical protein
LGAWASQSPDCAGVGKETVRKVLYGDSVRLRSARGITAVLGKGHPEHEEPILKAELRLPRKEIPKTFPEGV